MVSDRQTALRILGLTEGATDDEIRDAYKRMSMRW
jgi:DnaJ-class molecular chaperone